jgi:predicted PP-loop superfamily ATPase
MTLILTKAELERIRQEARENDDRPNYDKLKKADLKQKSLDRVKNWPNTLEALSKKKESFLKDRADEEELRRQEIDRQVIFIVYFF